MIEINKIIHGQALETVRTFESESIDCVITSPPYYQLRNYGFDEQWGLEKTYQEYLDNMISLMVELKRVIKPTGSIWINLGDSYSGSSNGSWNAKPEHLGKQKRYNKDGNYDAKYLGQGTSKSNSDISNKSLMLIPHRFAIRCIDELGLILRNDIIWAKRNGMPESVTDRFSKKHEFFFLFVKQQKYYFDLDGVRNKNVTTGLNRIDKTLPSHAKVLGGYKNDLTDIKNNPAGKNPGDVSDFWDINTKPSKSAHYATYNTQLIDKPIIAGCPEFVCVKCGKPREKIIEKIKHEPSEIYNGQAKKDYSSAKAQNPSDTKRRILESMATENKVIGLRNCGCNAGFKGGIILDPFCGTGTTLVRGMQLCRNVIGIDGNAEYVKQANKDIEPYLIQENLFK